MKAGQFLSVAPSASVIARNLTASPSIRSTSLRSMAKAPLSGPSAARRMSRSAASIRPLTYKTNKSSSTTRSILQAIVCRSLRANLTPSQIARKHSRNVTCVEDQPDEGRECRECREFRDFRESSAEFELALADLEGLDSGFERGGRNVKLRRRA